MYDYSMAIVALLKYFYMTFKFLNNSCITITLVATLVY